MMWYHDKVLSGDKVLPFTPTLYYPLNSHKPKAAVVKRGTPSMLALPAFFAFFVALSSANVPTIEKFAVRSIPKEAQELTGEALAEYVNKQQPFFKAKYSPNVERRMASLMNMKYLEKGERHLKMKMPEKAINNDTLPESFDSRQQWKDCPSLQYVRDQSHCGSCWAVSAASAMSDRLCIQTNGKNKVILSDTDILACCGEFCGLGCEGGYPSQAWEFAQRNGVCSGGWYGEKGVCKPYPLHPCGKHKNQTYYGECPNHTYRTPACKKYCQYGYDKRYDNDKVYVTSAYQVNSDEAAIRAEIMSRGPVQAAFTVYGDFMLYTRGIYVHTAGKLMGGHGVKIIGWGVENGTKYWTVANSWNSDWGEDGAELSIDFELGSYFRIVRGVDNCGFESDVIAGDFL